MSIIKHFFVSMQTWALVEINCYHLVAFSRISVWEGFTLANAPFSPGIQHVEYDATCEEAKKNWVTTNHKSEDTEGYVYM